MNKKNPKFICKALYAVTTEHIDTFEDNIFMTFMIEYIHALWPCFVVFLTYSVIHHIYTKNILKNKLFLLLGLV